MNGEKMLAFEKKFIGTKENPYGSNNVLFNTHYYGRSVSGSNYPWCMAFQWDCFNMANASECIANIKTASCQEFYELAKSKGLLIIENKWLMKTGDIVLYDFKGVGETHHVGMFSHYLNGNTFKSIEGNTSVTSQDNGGNVMERTRSINNIYAIVRPNYNSVEKEKGIYMFEVKRVLKNGISDKEVKFLKKLLNGSMASSHLDIENAYFGTITESVVKDYQRLHGLEVDGVVGKNTWRSLINL